MQARVSSEGLDLMRGPPTPVAAASTTPISTESSQPSRQAPAALQVSERPQAVGTDIPASGAIRDVPAPAAPAPIHTATWSPSFNCAKAGNSAERLICSNKELADADVRMASAYRQALASTKDKAQLRKEQNAWRVNRRDVCADTPCMLGAYQDRLAELARQE